MIDIVLIQIKTIINIQNINYCHHKSTTIRKLLNND